MYSNAQLSTLSWYKRKFLGGSTSPKVGKQSKISTQTQNYYIVRNFQNGNLNGPKGIKSYLFTLEVEMSLRGIRYLLQSEGFKAKRKIKTNFVNTTNKKKRIDLDQKTPVLYCKRLT